MDRTEGRPQMIHLISLFEEGGRDTFRDRIKKSPYIIDRVHRTPSTHLPRASMVVMLLEIMIVQQVVANVKAHTMFVIHLHVSTTC